jgi:hypothetical protein
MRQVRFKPSRLSKVTQKADRAWFAKWLVAARKATRAVIAQAEAGQDITFRQAIWSQLKAFLLKQDYFDGRCAYCESAVTSTDFGDAEHYRPKGKVTDENREVVRSGGIPHPGYYWLAYDWRNLLPACGQCNSGDGKMNQFPITAGCTYVTSHRRPRHPQALDLQEKPLLLHPYYHEPSRYLRFGEDGTIAAAPGSAQEMGDASIRTYNLWRGSLDGPRSVYQTAAWTEVMAALINGKPVPAVMAKYEKGLSPYSTACVQYVRLRLQRSKLDLLS